MKVIRVIVASLAFAVGTAALIFGALYAFGPDLTIETIEHSRSIDNAFRLAARYVDKFEKNNGRKPTTKEFEAWAVQADELAFSPYPSLKAMQLKLAPFPKAALDRFGPPPTTAYLLIYWRGEWNEYYSSWADRTSMDFEESAFYILGGKYADGALIMVIGAVVFLLGRLIWSAEPLEHAGARKQ